VHLAVKRPEPLEQMPPVLGNPMLATPSASKPSAAGALAQLVSQRAQSTPAGSVMRYHPCQYNDLMALPNALYSTAQVRALDAHAINELGIAGYTLMKAPAKRRCAFLRTRWPMAHRNRHCLRPRQQWPVTVTCWARFAHAAGLTVTVLSASPRSNCAATRARRTRTSAPAAAPRYALRAERLRRRRSIVDALLGTGLRGRARTRAGDSRHQLKRRPCVRPWPADALRVARINLREFRVHAPLSPVPSKGIHDDFACGEPLGRKACARRRWR